MSRWKVEVGFWWVAMQVDEQGREIPGTAKRFRTHAEAMAYADRRARTREYVLPRQSLPLSLPGIADDDALIYVTNGKNGCVYLKDEDHSETLTLYARELRPLALALLAHTERMGQ